MGDRYTLLVTCPKCSLSHTAWYAPTSGFIDTTCECGHIINLEEYTGIDAESTANTDSGRDYVRRLKQDE